MLAARSHAFSALPLTLAVCAAACALLVSATPLRAQDEPAQPPAAELLECAPVRSAVSIDGNLSEWTGLTPYTIGESNLVQHDPQYAGASDLSGRIWVARSATTLYVAGEVLDDTLFWNSERTFLGDGVEIFLDFAGPGVVRADDTPYDPFCYQLLLYPLATELRWKFAKFRSDVGRPDDPVDGVELAGLELRDGKTGYTFELALPLANFPGALELAEGEGGEFGFDVALSDSDGLPRQKNYATLSGRARLSEFPARFGRMRFGAPPPPTDSATGRSFSPIAPTAFLAVLLAALLFLWLARSGASTSHVLGRILAWLRSVRLRNKLLVGAVLGALLLLAGVIGRTIEEALDARDVTTKRDRVEALREIADEAARARLLEPQPPTTPAPLVALLSGQSLRPLVEYEYRLIDPAPEAPHRTLGRVPFLSRHVPALSAWSGDFVVFPPVTATSVTLIYSWEPDPGAGEAPQPGDDVAEFRFVHQNGVVDQPPPLKWSRHVIPFDAAIDPAVPQQGGPSEAAVAYLESVEREGVARMENGLEFTVKLADASAESPIVRVEVQQRATGGTFFVNGVTLHRGMGFEPVLLPLARATRTGMPTGAWPFPDRGDGLQLGENLTTAYIDCGATPADALWLVVSLRKGYRQSRFGAPVALVEAVFDDGSVDGPLRLENGVSIDVESTRAGVHDAAYRSETAFEWGLHGDQRHHYDVCEFKLERPGRRLHQLQFEFTGDSEVVRIASIVTGTIREAEHTNSRWFDLGPEGQSLPKDVLTEFAGLDFTLFRAGVSVATTATGDARERQLARRLTPDDAAGATDAPDGVHAVHVVDGERVHTLSVAGLGGRTNEVLEISWKSTANRALGDSVMLLRAALAALLAPLLVLLVADLVLRLPSLHARLVAGFAAAAAIPVGLGAFAVPGLVESKIETTERETVLAKAKTVKERLATLSPLARRQAESVFEDEALQEALMRQGADDFRAGVAAALRDSRRNVSVQTGLDARIALQLFPLSTAGESAIVIPERTEVFSGNGADISDQMAYRYCRLSALGVARSFDGKNNWKKTLVVELPLDLATLRGAKSAAGGDAEVLLYSERGYPIVGTLHAQGQDAPDEIERKQEMVERVLGDQRPRVVSQEIGGAPYTVAYDVLRIARDRVCLVATAIPRGGADALLSRVGYVSILVFGAGVFMQFLLAGLLVDATMRPVRRLLERAGIGGRLGAPPRPGSSSPDDELATLAAAVESVRGDRDLYQRELARLHEAAGILSSHHEPRAVVDEAIAIVRHALGAWGAVILGRTDDGRGEVLAGFRGDARVPAGPVPLTGDGPLARVVRGEHECHVHTAEELAEALGPEELRLIGVAHSLDAYPLGGPDAGGGALVLLEPSRREPPPPPYHAEFAAALARHVGVALAGARLVRLAVRDPDSGCYVASYFEQRLKEEVDRAVAAKRAIALLLVRATDLPADTMDQSEALRRLATAVRSRTPDRAFAGRLDSDTIAVAVSETERAEADALAIELRRTLAEPGLAALRGRVGVASCPEDAGSSEFLRLEAERSLGLESGDVASDPPSEAGGTRERLRLEARRLGAVFDSEKGLQILDTVERIAGSDITILIEGETGVGKEIVADLIHRKSTRSEGALVKVNCAALPDALLESELFGYEQGAFTGADRTKPGRFELAHGGTLFLDEIGEMPLATQVKILRVLEDRVVEHLGGTRPIPVDVRVITATNRDLRGAIAAGRFREDLYYRLNAVTIAVPPLRARKDDIPALADAFVRAAAETHGRKPPTIGPDAMDALFRHEWPGNVRELRNVLEQAVVLSNGPVLRAQDVRPALRSRPAGGTRSGPASSGRGARASAEPASAATADISNRQRRLLAVLAERDWITNAEYCELVNVSTRTGLRDLQDLIQRGVLDMDGKRRGARYRLSD